MLVGAQVGSSGGLLRALQRGRDCDADVIQIFTQSPRMWRAPSHSPEQQAAFQEAQAADPRIHTTYCHATYLINLAAPDSVILDKSTRNLVENLVAASAIGAVGLVLHVGSHRGAGFDSAVTPVAARLLSALDEAASTSGQPVCPLLLENTAGAGGTMGRTFEELARLLDAASGDQRIGFCIDTQHLFASGVPYRDQDEADAVIENFDATIGIGRLACLHLNDSKVPLGANRDRHENLGDGEIGSVALGWLISHPFLDSVPAILEVPGSGEGPRREDLAKARRILAAGRKRRRPEPTG